MISGRYGPGPGWQAAPEWRGLIRALELSPLSKADSVKLLHSTGATADQAEAVYRVARGHPMALVLGGFGAHSAGANIGGSDSASLVQKLMQVYLSEVQDPDVRTAWKRAPLYGARRGRCCGQ